MSFSLPPIPSSFPAGSWSRSAQPSPVTSLFLAPTAIIRSHVMLNMARKLALLSCFCFASVIKIIGKSACILKSRRGRECAACVDSVSSPACLRVYPSPGSTPPAKQVTFCRCRQRRTRRHCHQEGSEQRQILSLKNEPALCRQKSSLCQRRQFSSPFCTKLPKFAAMAHADF